MQQYRKYQSQMLALSLAFYQIHPELSLASVAS